MSKLAAGRAGLRHAVCLTLLLGTLAAVTVRANATSPVRLSWEELPNAVLGKTVLIAIPDGPMVTGKATGITSDALLIDIRTTTNAASHPKGPARLPRASVRALQVRTKGKVFRVVGTALGSAAGFGGGAGAAWGIGGGILGNQHQTQATAAFFGIWAGGTAAGYFLGNAADRRWSLIEITQ